MARRKLSVVRPRAEPEPEPVPRTLRGLRFRRVVPATTAEQLDEFFASRKLEPHGDGSFENAEPIVEKTRRTKSRGSNKSST